MNLSLDEMQKIHLKPFVEAINDNIEMIMVAHLYCRCFDNKHIPASLSQNVIGYLRNVMNYKGVIISDDMVMKGVQAFGSLEACLMAINAGVDMFIFRDSDFETLDMIEKLVKIVENDKILQDKVLKSNKRIMDLKKRYRII